METVETPHQHPSPPSAVNRFVPSPIGVWRRGSPVWLLIGPALVLTLLAGCMPVQAPTRFEGLSSGLDNARQARIRTESGVLGARSSMSMSMAYPRSMLGSRSRISELGNFSGWLYAPPAPMISPWCRTVGRWTRRCCPSGDRCSGWTWLIPSARSANKDQCQTAGHG